MKCELGPYVGVGTFNEAMGACGSILTSDGDASGKYVDGNSSTEAKSRSDTDQSTYEAVGASRIFVTSVSLKHAFRCLTMCFRILTVVMDAVRLCFT